MRWSAPISVAALLAGLAACSPAPGGQTNAAPPAPSASATADAPIELSQLIVEALPTASERTVGWDHMLASPVVWKTDGYREMADRSYERVGTVRVRVRGRVTTVLKQRREALPWTVTLDSLDDPKWGPEAVEIEPGDPDNGGCFGPLFAGCNFTAAEALTGAGLTSKRLCRAQPGDDGGFREIYAISAPGRAPGFATFDVDFGSGGETDTLMVTWDAGPPPCRSGEIGLTRSPP